MRKELWTGIVEDGVVVETTEKDNEQVIELQPSDDWSEDIKDTLMEEIEDNYTSYKHGSDFEENKETILTALREDWKDEVENGFDETFNHFNDSLEKSSKWLNENMKDVVADAKSENIDLTDTEAFGEYLMEYDFGGNMDMDVFGYYGLVPPMALGEAVSELDSFQDEIEQSKDAEIEL